MFLIAGCMLLYVHCERLYETMAVVRFNESPPQRLLSMAKDATGLIRPKVKFYEKSIIECEEGLQSKSKTSSSSNSRKKQDVYSIDVPIRSSSAVASLALSSARRGSLINLMASSKLVPGSEDDVRTEDTFDVDSSHVIDMGRKGVCNNSSITAPAIAPLSPAYQSSHGIKISRMPLALFSYLHDDVLVLPPGFLSEMGSKS